MTACRKAFGHRTTLRGFLDWTVSRGEVHVKVFGGAKVVGIGAAAKPAIGKLDSEAAIEVFEPESFKIIASSLGGNLGQQLQFHTGTGEVALRWLGKPELRTLLMSEENRPFLPIE
jgi:chemotaxis receptor (MCP) glutamine deamidase CheD